MVVTSFEVPLADPPPEMLAWLVTCAGALPATSTNTEMAGIPERGSSASLRVQVSVARVQVHPWPVIDVAVTPAGSGSGTGTVPEKAAVSQIKITKRDNAPHCPCGERPG